MLNNVFNFQHARQNSRYRPNEIESTGNKVENIIKLVYTLVYIKLVKLVYIFFTLLLINYLIHYNYFSTAR